MSRLKRAAEMPCAASGSAWVSAEYYERMRVQALAADPPVESDGETICLAGQPESRSERVQRGQPGQREMKGGSERLIVVLADLVVGQEQEQAHG